MANRRVALVGCGMVGMSYAYALLNSDLCNELILMRKRLLARQWTSTTVFAFQVHT